MNTNTKKELKSWGKSLFIALGISFVVRTFLVAPYIVEGASMEPTLHNHDKIFVNKLHLKEDFKRGEIGLIQGKTENYVKRIIGLPGDTILMKDDQLYVNGNLTEEPYLSHNRKLTEQMGGGRLTGDFGPVNVPKNEFFVMGDNRLYSMDSRNGLGFIPRDEIVGQSEMVYFPFKNVRKTN
ncbi:signal peptidase I [Neobacillus terrae]|uniref:signal peptidase I n=1 Tax=Neobacillus terrae TaxID=3034837 RepID=UPI00140D0819|nr:signal peptidase I [Neobacillus terrae]NHM30960.1 signal peptidase I [Neobacillus terrae]